MFDAFLKVGDIPGESTDQNHEEWIEILGFDHGLSQASSGSKSSGGGASAERCNHQPFKIRKHLDIASAKLAEACCKGDHIPEVQISLCRAGGDKLEYMNYKLSKVMVTEYAPAGDSNSQDALPTEMVCFEYGQIEWTYTRQQLADGTGGGQVATGWNLETNSSV